MTVTVYLATYPLSVFAQMYSDEMLSAKYARVKENLEYTIKKDIPSHAAPSYQARAAKAVPDIQMRSLEFLDFLHEGNVVPVGIDSLQFLDDLSTVRAWLDSRGCDGSLLQNYIVHHVTPNGQPLDPMSAFGLDRNTVLHDRVVNDVSGKYYHTAVWFLLAHEIGHVAIGQSGPSTLNQENAADDFALEVMRQKRLPPVGVVLYMTVISLYSQQVATRTHASNGERVERIANTLRRSPQDFVAANDKNKKEQDITTVLKIADELAALAKALKLVRKAEEALAASGEKIDEIYKTKVFKTVDYKTACVAPY